MSQDKQETTQSKSIAEVMGLTPDQIRRQELTLLLDGKSEPWNDIELSEEETSLAILKMKKEKYYEVEQRIKREELERQREFYLGPWTARQAGDFMLYRSRRFGFTDEKPFQINDSNRDLINALCYYFVNDPRFEQKFMEVPNEDGTTRTIPYSLKKGLLIMGRTGCGKTKIMKLFAVNKKQCYNVFSCIELANEFARKGDRGGDDVLDLYSTMHHQVASFDNFHTEKWGACFDDLGAEQNKNYYGNPKNVLQEILQLRYNNTDIPRFATHITTNLNMVQLEERYGPRVVSRIFECYNIIGMPGEDWRLKG